MFPLVNCRKTIIISIAKEYFITSDKHLNDGILGILHSHAVLHYIGDNVAKRAWGFTNYRYSLSSIIKVMKV